MLKVFEFIETVAMFHSYMMHEHTGDAATFAEKLGISRATLFNLINELKDYGIHVEYSRVKKSYRYLYPDRVRIQISICELSEEEFKKIRGDNPQSTNLD